MRVFWWFFKYSGFWVQIKHTDNFASLDTPGGPRGVKVVEIFVFEKHFSCFLDVGATW